MLTRLHSGCFYVLIIFFFLLVVVEDVAKVLKREIIHLPKREKSEL
jgi:hypothetical protein